MQVLRFENPTEFLSATKVFRKSDPIRTGLITSIANSVVNGTRSYEGYFWWAVAKDGEIEGLAIRTIPYGYVLSPMSHTVVESLHPYISAEDSTAKEFAGSKSVIDHLEKISGKFVAEEESELLYQNQRLIPALSVGEVRTAELKDFSHIFTLMKAFIAETGLRNFDLEKIVSTALNAGRYTLLEIDGSAVCLGGNSDIQDFESFSICRVGPIYTPPEHRRKGYASALTSAITKKLLDQGVTATLYTQAGNPTSNKIYQDLGYMLVDENRKVIFT